MIKVIGKNWLALLGCLLVTSCASYSISEQEMTDYLEDNLNFNQSLGVANVMYAQVSVDDLAVKIGRVDDERVSIAANTNADIQMLSMQGMSLDLDLEFSAVPEYDKDTGEIFLKSLRLEHFNDKSQRLTPEIATLLKPAVAMLGQALSTQPVYKLDSKTTKEALVKSARPNLVIKNNKLVIELFN
ncbi:DUF1439 domain-containing protein [Vibrio sp. WXL210]|uniref:DUF1439 domain-containing protein n=1 Tax=Vibrio sp. WXL210 TaxID=3450709 RepID=UPI003EC94F44